MTLDEVRELSATRDIVRLAMLADDVRRRGHKDRVTFVRVAHATVGALDDLAPLSPSAGELRVTGAPRTLSEAVGAVRAARERAHGVPVSAFSSGELDAAAQSHGESLARWLEELRAVGLERVVDAVFDGSALKLRGHLTAARDAGLRVGRLGWREASPDWVEQLMDVGSLDGVDAVSPLPQTADAEAPTTGYEDLKRVAITRLVVGAEMSVQVDWTRAGAKLAQVALTWGANDLDDIPVEAGDGALEGRRGVLLEVRRNIEAAALVPVERDGAGAARHGNE